MRLGTILLTTGILGLAAKLTLTTAGEDVGGPDVYDLRPQFTAGQSLTTSANINMTMSLESADGLLDGKPVSSDATLDLSINVTEQVTDNILAVDADGAPSHIDRSYDVGSIGVSGGLEAADYEMHVESTENLPLAGKSYDLQSKMGGATVVTGQAGDPNGGRTRSTQMIQGHYEFLLPTGPVSVGDSWDVGANMHNAFDQAALANIGINDDLSAMLTEWHNLYHAGQIQATGTLSWSDNQNGTVSWSASGCASLEDLAGTFELMANAEDFAGFLACTVVGSGQVCFSGSGVGTYNYETGQLTSISWSGGYSISSELSGTGCLLNFEGSSVVTGSFTVDGGVSASVEVPTDDEHYGEF